jgi:AcrR family transcriptional regulator
MKTISTEPDVANAAAGAGAPIAEGGTRERIVAAALEVFVDKGYGGTRVQDIAEHAGLTAGALYVHFPNRSKLLAEAITVEGGRILSGLIEELGRAQPGEGRIAGVLNEQMVAESQLIDRLLVEAFALAARDEDSQEQLSTTLGFLDVLISDTVSRAVDNGSLDPRLSSEAVTAFFSSWIMGIIVHRAVLRPRPEFDDMSVVVSRLLSGLAPPDEE